MITWFIDDGNSENRKYLYKLENLGIIMQERTKKENSCIYKWKLTEKGEKLIKSDNKLKTFFESKDFKEIYFRLCDEEKD
ncbi:MAG: hypothetical protein QXD13_01600 [Candidatus Pacearchaeota archaeon]